MTEQIPAPEDFISLRDKIEQLETKYKELRLATLEWGKDVETLQIRSDQHLQRIEALEANAKPASNPPQTRPSDITPPPELVQEWVNSLECPEGWGPKVPWIAARAAAWGYQQAVEELATYIRQNHV